MKTFCVAERDFGVYSLYVSLGGEYIYKSVFDNRVLKLILR